MFLGHRVGPLGVSDTFNSHEALYLTQEGATHGLELGAGELGVDTLLELAVTHTTGTQGLSVLEPVVNAGGGFFSYVTLGAVQQAVEHKLYDMFNGPEGNPYHVTPIH